MQTTRTVAQIEAATTAMVGPHTVKRALPVRHLKQVDPFIFIDYLAPYEVATGTGTERIPPHPHAGFEVVTYLIEGKGFHRDSIGNEQLSSAGDINWMTSGKGIIHSEGSIEEKELTNGRNSLMQVWINLPAAKKFIDPSFRHYAAATLPVIDKGNTWVKVLIGTYEGVVSPVSTYTPMYYYHVKVKVGEVFSYAVDPAHTAGIYVMDGSMKVLDHAATAGTVLEMNNDGDTVAVRAITDVTFIAFGGLPINEKVVSYGPFVMNDFGEIQKAIEDYETGKMGFLEY